MDPFLKDFLTIAMAAVGAVLGVMNTWNSVALRRVKLKVIPAFALAPSGVAAFSIEVVNQSAFPVTVTEVGFTLIGQGGRRGAIIQPIVPDGKPWPRRLEAREAVSVLCLPEFDPGTRIGKAYAKLASGETETGTSPALKQLAESFARA